MASSTYYADPKQAEDFATQLLVQGGGLPEEQARLMAACLVQADLRGVVSPTGPSVCTD